MRIEPPPSLPWAIGTMPGRDRRGRASARAAGRPVEVPRIARRAVHARLRRRKDPELGRLGGAGEHEALLAQAAHQVGVVVARVPAQEGGAVVEREPRGLRVGLDSGGHAGEQAAVLGVERGGLGECAVAVDTHERAQFGLGRLDAA